MLLCGVEEGVAWMDSFPDEDVEEVEHRRTPADEYVEWQWET